jgi:hypothetical protein
MWWISATFGQLARAPTRGRSASTALRPPCSRRTRSCGSTVSGARAATRRRAGSGAAAKARTGPSPTASLASVLAGFDVNERRGEALRHTLYTHTARVVDHVRSLGLATPNVDRTPIVELPLVSSDVSPPARTTGTPAWSCSPRPAERAGRSSPSHGARAIVRCLKRRLLRSHGMSEIQTDA